MENLKCTCGNTIPQKNIDQITLNGKYPHFAAKAKCQQCVKSRKNDVERVAGVMPTDHKMKGELIVCSQEQAARYKSLSQRSGTGVSRGVKFHTGRK
jgi:hypothetical protein